MEKLKSILSEKISLTDIIQAKTAKKTLSANHLIDNSIKIVHLCTHDHGGAGNSAYRLHRGLKIIGLNSTMLVMNKISADQSVKVLPEKNEGDLTHCLDILQYESPLWPQQRNRWSSRLSNYPDKHAGLEIYTDALSDIRIDLIREIQEADIVNLHWVAGTVDWTFAAKTFKNKPLVWTLHDMNPFTGGCHYSGDCDKYEKNCGACHLLGSNIDDDLSKEIWNLKSLAYQQLNFNIVSPSKWLRHCASKSKLFCNFQTRVIPYGLPTDIFQPYPKKQIRKALNIPDSASVILFGAASVSNERKGFKFLLEGLNRLSQKDGFESIMLTFGNFPEKLDFTSKFPIYNLGSIRDESQVALAYNAADVFVIPSLEDNLPNTVLEAISCGIPVVGFNVGGVSDMIEHMKNGYLAEPKNINSLMAGIEWVLSLSSSDRNSFKDCRERAVEKYDLEIQARAYAELYGQILNSNSNNRSRIKRCDKESGSIAMVDDSENSDAASAMYSEAHSLINRGKNEAGIHALQVLLEHFPDYALAHNDIGVLLYNAGSKNEALAHYQKAVRLVPEDVNFQKNLADFYCVELGQVEKALNIYVKILESDPNDIETLIALAKICTELEKFEDAKDFYDRILALDYSNQIALKGLENLKNRNDQLPPSSCNEDCQTCSCDKDYLVSAIVSCYNSEDFIRGRLEDLEAQTIAKKLEIILIDSGSEQNERAIIDEFKQNYSNIQYIRTENRETIYAAWNLGAKSASGKYIVNANTDDRLRCDALEIMVKALEENSSAGAVYIDQILTNYPNETLNNHHTNGFLKRTEATREIMVQKNSCGPQVMWRRELHDKIGYFRSDYEVAGDWDLWLRVIFETDYTILHIPELLGLYYYNLGGLEHGGRKQKERLWEINAIKEKYGKLYRDSSNSASSKCDSRSNKAEDCKIEMAGNGNLEPISQKKKKAKNVLLTTSAAPSQTPFSTTEKRAPIGIGFLISVLRDADHNVFFIDNYLKPSDFLESDYLQANDIQFVGIYANTICYRDTLRMLHKLEWLRQTGQWKGKIIVGGPHTTVCLDTIPDFVDYVVRGEGEKAIVDIVEGKVSERVVKYPRMKNLDELPMPAWDYFIDMPYDWGGDFFPEGPVFSMNTSRGCPFSCQFCSVKSIWGKRYTHFSAERIVDDIEHLVNKYGARGIYFREDNFTLNRKRLIKFCNLLLERRIQISWACESRVNALDEETVAIMSKAGACGFYFGVESGSQEILDLLKKGIKTEETRTAFQLCHKYNIKTAASIVVGVPNETEADLKKTLSLVEEIKPTLTWFNVFVGIPKSELYEYTLRNKLYEFVDDRGLVYLKGHNQRVQAFYGGRWDADIPSFSADQPKISVVMSVVNGEDYVESAIKSILSQTSPDFEFIIVDDASTDHTPEILTKFDDPRIKIFTNNQNLGLTKCLNNGISASKGKIIARMDADDISLPHRFEKQLDFLEKNPDYALVGSAYYKINEDGTICQLVNVLTGDEEIKKGLKKQNWFGHGSVMMRRDVFLEMGGYNAQFKYAQDYDLWLRISEKYKVANIKEPLYYWRSTDNSISGENKKEQRDFAILALAKAHKREKNAENSQSLLPMVSVIVPTFNRPQMLEEAIKSILSQTYNNFEIIVVNDRGEDVSRLITKFQDHRIKYVQHEQNKGLAATRNTGIKYASGQFIALLDDDDIFYPEHLEIAAKNLSEEHPVIYTDAIRASYERYENTYKLLNKNVPYSIDFVRNKLLIGNISPVNCFVFNKNLALKAGLFDETLSTLEDWDFWIRLSALTPFKHIAQTTVQVNWRNDGTTMTSLLGSEFRKNRERIYSKYQDEINQIPDINKIIEEFQQIWAQDWQMESQLTSIIILTCNQLEYTKKCIDSIYKHTQGPFELIFVDNGSTDLTVEYLESEVAVRNRAVRVKIIKNKKNKGFAAGNNQGIAAARGKYILLMNNDIVVTPGWIDRLINCAKRNPKAGIVGPMSNYVSGPQLVEDVDYNTQTLEGLEQFSAKVAEQNAVNEQRLLRVVGFCMLIKRAVIDKIGGMDDRYGLGNFEDDDFSLRATIAGFESWIARDCFIHHFGHRTFVGEKLDLHKSLLKNWEVFKEKWGLPREMPYGSPYRLADMKNTKFDPPIHHYLLEKGNAIMEKPSDDFKTAETAYSAIQGSIHTKPSGKIIEELEKLVNTYPKFAVAHNDLGVLYYNAGNKEKAHQFYEKAVQLDAENMVFQKNLADFYFVELGRIEDALRIYIKVLEFNPKDVETLLITGHICVALHKFEDARVFYQRTLELEPWNEDAKKNLGKLSKVGPNSLELKSAEEMHQEIQPLLNNGDSHRAIASLERILEDYPGFALAHNDLGVISYHIGNKEKTQYHYEQAIKLMPDNINFQKNLADFYCIELGRIEEALQIYVSILKTNPQDIETLMATGQICKALEKPDDARDFFNQVLQVEPWNADARRQIEAMENQPAGAIFNTESAENAYRRLQEKLNTLTAAEAIDELEKIVEIYSDFEVGHNDLGVLYFSTGHKEKALHHYQQAAGLQPENMTLQKNLADFLLVELRKVEDALQIYVNILATHPDDVETLLIVGHICVALNKFDNAKDFYRQVLALEPDNEDANTNLQVLIKGQSERASARPDSLNDVTVSSAKAESTDVNIQEPEKQHAEYKTTVSMVISLDGIQNRVKECLKSIQAHTDEPHELLLVDRGANKGMLKWARKFVQENDHYRTIECAKQAGWAESINQAIQKASGEMIVLLHNDVVVPEGWLKAFKRCINLVSNIGVVGPMSNRAEGIQQMIHSDESDRVEFESAAKAFYEQNQYRRVPVRKLSDFCLAFRRGLLDKIGYLDEKVVSEEIVVENFCNRAASGGCQNLIVADTYVYHYDRHKAKRSVSVERKQSIEDRKKLTEKLNCSEVQNHSTRTLQTARLLTEANDLSAKGEIDQAIEILLSGIGIQPEEDKLYLALAEILVTAKRFQDAKDALYEMPEHEKPQETRTRIEEPQLNAEANSEIFAGASTLANEMKKITLLAYAEEGLRNFEVALAHIERVLAANPSSATALNLKGIIAYRNQDRKSAEQFFCRAIESDPGYGEPYTNLGILRLEDEQGEAALELFEKGFILSPSDFDIATIYHSLISGLNDYQRAEKLAREAVILYPNNQKIKYMLIDCLVQLDKYNEAMEEIEGAIVKFGIEDGIITAALKVREKLGTIQIEKSSKNTAVSLCMIVKNEEKYLAKCLASVKPIVDEMIVVDTGSNDRTKDIAEAFGAKLYDYDWDSDFAKARNYSVSKAEGDWIFVMDADEVISPRDYDHFRKIVSKRPKTAVAYSIITRNYNSVANMIGWTPNDGKYPDEEAVSGWLPSSKVRLFYGKDQVWFEGAVHEMVDPVLKRKGIRIKQSRIPIHHYGRLNKENVNRKDEAYFEIGKKKLEDMADDINAIRELAVQATNMGKNEEALKLWEKLLSLNAHPKVISETYINMGTIYNRMGNYQDALEAAKKAVVNAPDLKEARYNYAVAELYSGDLNKTITVLENLLSEVPNYPPARFILAAAYCCTSDKETGFMGLNELKATPLGPFLVYSCAELAKGLITAKRHEHALTVLSSVIECEIINTEIMNLFAECIRLREEEDNTVKNSRQVSFNNPSYEFENLRQC